MHIADPIPWCRMGPGSLLWVSLRTSWDAIGPNNALTWENARGSCIYTNFVGTSEIQRLIISRAISGVHIR